MLPRRVESWRVPSLARRLGIHALAVERHTRPPTLTTRPRYSSSTTPLSRRDGPGGLLYPAGRACGPLIKRHGQRAAAAPRAPSVRARRPARRGAEVLVAGHSFIARWCGLCLNRYLWRCRPAAAVDIDACTESSLGWRAPSRQHRRDPAITAGALDGLPRTSSSGPSVSANPPSLGVVGHPPKTSGQLAPSHPQPGTFPFDLARTFDLISSTSSLPPPAATVPL